MQILDLQRGRADPQHVPWRPTPNAVDSTVVVVENGTPTAGLGSKAADDLRGVGFSIPPEYVGDADRFDYTQTVVRYLPGDEAKAEQVASRLNATPIVEDDELHRERRCRRRRGRRLAGGTLVARSDGLAAHRHHHAPRARRRRASAPSPTSTTIGVVPQTPEDVSC